MLSLMSTPSILPDGPTIGDISSAWCPGPDPTSRTRSPVLRLSARKIACRRPMVSGTVLIASTNRDASSPYSSLAMIAFPSERTRIIPGCQRHLCDKLSASMGPRQPSAASYRRRSNCAVYSGRDRHRAGPRMRPEPSPAGSHCRAAAPALDAITRRSANHRGNCHLGNRFLYAAPIMLPIRRLARCG